MPLTEIDFAIVLIIVIGLQLAINYFIWLQLSKKIDSVAKIQDNNNTTIVRLVYHTAIKIEDYEAVAKIKKAMPKDFEYDRFF